MEKIKDKERLDMLNLYFDTNGHLQKYHGYKSFVGLVKILYKINKNNHKLGIKTKLNITLPVKWA